MSDVDTSIHPHSTGPAAELAAAHAAPEPLKMYGGWFCPYVQRAWMVLEEKGIPYQYIETNPYKKTPEFLALNPRGLVPTVATPCGRAPLYESPVVCEYLEEAFPDSGEPLLPRDAYGRARCRIWMQFAGDRVVPCWYRLMQHTPSKSYSLDEARAELHANLATFVREMAPAEAGGPWFLGRSFSLVDVMLAPWAARMWLLDHYKDGGSGIPGPGEGGDDEAVWARWRVWAEAVMARGSMVATLSDPDKYIGVYRRYADDTTNSLVAQATRLGRRLP
jgi:glutathione S-transferase